MSDSSSDSVASSSAPPPASSSSASDSVVSDTDPSSSSPSPSPSSPLASSSSASPLVLVTGGTSFVAGWVIRLLLRENFRVRTTVRNPTDPSTLNILRRIRISSTIEEDEIINVNWEDEEKKFTESKQEVNIECVKAELLSTPHDEWVSAVKGCQYVIHIASPFSLNKEKDVEKQFVVPAVEGTLSVLRAITAAGGVKRCVLTSSCASVAYGWGALSAGKIFDEKDFSVEKQVDGYVKSKLKAEESAWNYVKELKDNPFELSTVNPSFVLGPLLHNKAAASSDLIIQLLDGKFPFLPHMAIPICDVRDVAKAHVRAMSEEKAKGNRFIVNTTVDHPPKKESLIFMNLIAKHLQTFLVNKEMGYAFGSREAPNFLISFASLFDSTLKSSLEEIKYPKLIDGSKITRELGIQYHSWGKSVEEMGKSVHKFKMTKLAQKKENKK